MTAFLHSLRILAGSLVDPLADLVLPRPCLGCRAPTGPLCPRCRPAGPPLRLATRLDGEGVPVTAAAAYDGAVRAAVLAYKERGRRDLAPALGGLLAEAVRAARDGPAVDGPPEHFGRLVLVPVPTTSAARAARGGDHVGRLATQAGRLCGLPVAAGVLILLRRPDDSAGLDVAARAQNLAGAMQASAAPPGRRALVIDDVVTTGATLRESVRALRSAGWPVAGAATVAATPRRWGKGAVRPLAVPR